MTSSIFNGGALYMGEDLVSNQVKQFGIDAEADAIDVTAMDERTRANIGGLKSFAWASEMYIDPLFEIDVFNRLNATTDAARAGVVTYFPLGGIAQDERCYLFRSRTGKMTLHGALGEADMVAISGEAADLGGGSGSQALVFGYLSALGNAVAASANGVGRQLGILALATQRMAMGGHVTALTGTAVITFILESDDNAGFSSPTTRATSSALSAIGQFWTAPVAGPIATDDYWRIRYTITGTGTVTFRASMGRFNL